MEPVTKFVHTALFKSEHGGWNELNIKITFNGRYTVLFTKRGPDYETEEISSITDMLYFPESTMKMISTTGECVFSNLDHLCNLLTDLCTKTIVRDSLLINTIIQERLEQYLERIEILEATLDKVVMEKYQLQAQLELSKTN